MVAGPHFMVHLVLKVANLSISISSPLIAACIPNRSKEEIANAFRNFREDARCHPL